MLLVLEVLVLVLLVLVLLVLVLLELDVVVAIVSGGDGVIKYEMVT